MKARLVLCAAMLVVVAQVSAQSTTPPVSPTAQGPSVGELVRMAKRAASHIDPARIKGLVRRARLAGLSPTLKVGVDRGLKQDLSSSTSSDAERLAAAVGDDFSIDASLTFDLSRLVFAPEEVRLLSVERWLAGDQRKLVEEAIRLYFQRRKLLLEHQASADPELDLAISELNALLDALTDGGFGRALAASAHAG
jgi:hypothetical protein